MKRVCERCHREIPTGVSFFANECEGKKADEVWCADCIDDVIEHEFDLLDRMERAELLGFGAYEDEPEPVAAEELPIPGQMNMFEEE